VNELAWKDGELRPNGQVVLGAAEKLIDEDLQNAGFVGGLAVTPDGQRLFAVQVLGKSLVVVDLPRRRVIRVVDLSAEPYTCVLAPDGKALYVSVWGAARVLRFDTTTLEQTGDFAVGEHPNAMAFSKDSARLFVACANTNAVWVIDLAAGTARERISVALYPNAPAGSTPNALAVSPNGDTLLVANADNNTVAVVDIVTPGKSDVEGFVPTGWYPTGVAFDSSGKRIFVLSGKGLTSEANPRGTQPEAPGREGQYVGGMMQGALSTLDVPDDQTLAAWTKRVYAITPYTDARRLAPPEAPKATPIPRRVGGPSPIRYVFYVIRENRTYDQVLGDIEHGNGDPTLTLFGEEITPNAHAIARQFVLFDNFYVDAEVSFDGHAYSTAAYATDVVEKIWPTNYGGRGGVYLSEGGWGDRNPYGNLSAPPDGYIWDFAKRAGVSVRSYGEFARLDKTGTAIATVPGLKGLVHPQYPPWDMKVPDGKRADVWLEEFRRFEQSGEPPRLSIIRLGNDHTAGTRPGWPTPRAMVAENDAALGRIVEAVSHSRFWKESAIFVLEDDAQNGPDHVDAHRSVLLVASPFARRNALDRTLYTTSGVLRTMELILGLPPMSQYDAAATPMYNAFQPKPELTTFKGLPARVRTDEQNPPDAPGAQASMRMNMAEADLTPELELNEIIWQSIHGRGAVMPPPVRSGFIRPVAEDED
jgi:YVTN family beta-propeller protein